MLFFYVMNNPMGDDDIEDGIIKLDDQLKDRIKALKNERDLAQAQACLDRIAEQLSIRTTLTPERVAAFNDLMRDKIDNGDLQAKKAFLRAFISEICVDDEKTSIIGNKAKLAAIIAGQNTGNANVSSFVRKWRAGQDEDDSIYTIEITV